MTVTVMMKQVRAKTRNAITFRRIFSLWERWRHAISALSRLQGDAGGEWGALLAQSGRGGGGEGRER